MTRPTLTAVDFDPFSQGSDLELTTASSESQRELWTASRMDDDASRAFNEAVSLRLLGALDTEALRGALRDLVARHEALRASFTANGTTLCVARQVNAELELVDLAPHDPARRAAALAELQRREVETSFDLERGPLSRATLARLAPEEHVFFLTAHHLVCDGWSMGVLLRDLAALYTARRGGNASLRAAPRFSDYARMAALREGTAEHQADELWWLRQFAALPPNLDLPSDRPRPPTRTFAADRVDHPLDATLVDALKQTGARHSTSFFTTMLAALEAWLHRMTGADDLVVAIPAAGQAITGMREVVGHCVNTLPLRTPVRGDESFAALLTRVRTGVLDALEHQQYTFGTLLRRLPLPRDPSRLPLVSVMFNLDSGLDEAALGFADLAVTFATTPRRFESFELFINAMEVRGGLVLQVQFNTDLFDRATVERWMRAFERFLRAVAAHPDTLVAALPLMGPDEHAQLASWNDTRRDYSRSACVDDLVAAQCAKSPDALALVASDVELTYRDLDERSNQVARRLRALGVTRDSLVGLYVERGAEMLIAMLGTLKAGGAYVPLDPAFPAERLAFMCEDARLAVLVTTSALAASAPRSNARALILDRDEGLAAASRAPVQDRHASPESLAYVIYTSGSTGTPKGVEVPHSAVVNFLESVAREPGLGAGDRLLAVTTLSFDIAVLELLGPLTVGATVFLATRETASDGAALAAAITRHDVNVMQATPATWRLLVAAGWRGKADFRILCGGEALPRDLALELAARGALWNMYGPTETTVWSTAWQVTQPLGRIVVGRPLANTQVHVLDARRAPLPIGVIGELYIGGDGVTRGYLRRPELTSERFVPDPFGSSGARMYRTGDLARWCADGTLEFLGRNDTQVKVRGHRIELGEIESALATHPAVRQAVVAVHEVRPGDARLVAYAVRREDEPATDSELRKHLRRSLPEYMIPQHFVELEALPLTPNGKVDRRRLPAPFAKGPSVDDYVAPRTAGEQLLATLWCEALRVARVGLHDNFFDLGGHSLLCIAVLTRLEEQTGKRMSPRAMLRDSLEQVAAQLDALPAGRAPTQATGQEEPSLARRVLGNLLGR